MGLIDKLLGRGPLPLREEVLAIIARLSEPVSEAEAGEGWDADLKEKWRNWFANFDRRLVSGDAPDHYLGTARAMDFDGVGRTELSRLAASIDVRFNKGERYS